MAFNEQKNPPEGKYLPKHVFAAELGMSVSTIQRREKEIDMKLPHRLISPEIQDLFKAMLSEYELKKLQRNDPQINNFEE